MEAIVDTIEPTRVVQSFLIQLLLRYSINDVRRYLETFLQQVNDVIRDEAERVELCVMFVQCFVNYYYSQQKTVRGDALHCLLNPLRTAQRHIRNPELNMKKLESIAMTRFVLDVVADWLVRVFIRNERANSGALEPMIDTIMQLCSIPDFRWPSLYLARRLNRQFGTGVLLELSAQDKFRWILPETTAGVGNQALAAKDCFVVCHNNNHYKNLRDAISELIIGRNADYLQNKVQELDDVDNIMKEHLLCLAFYRQIVAFQVQGTNDAAAIQRVIQLLTDFCLNSDVVREKEFALDILRNELGAACPLLNIQQQQQIGTTRDLIEIVAHFYIVSQTIKIKAEREDDGGARLLGPLYNLVIQPRTMANCLLPTMPEDNLSEIREALLEGRSTSGDVNPVLYQCPNGHPYVVGNCGRPMVQARCLQCNEIIGGVSHRSEPGNSTAWTNDRTEFGHILGSARNRSREPAPERDLSPAATAALRLLSHAAMLLGSITDQLAISDLIRGRPDNVAEFLWEHLLLDIDILARSIGRSPDDTVLLMHVVIGGLLDEGRIEDLPVMSSRFTDKKARQRWENIFAANCITRHLSRLHTLLTNAQTQLLNDTRLGTNPLMRRLFEVNDDDTSRKDDDNGIVALHDNSAIWKTNMDMYVTVENLAQKLQEGEIKGDGNTGGELDGGSGLERHSVLKLFLQKEVCLRALHNLPDIFKLQSKLLAHFHRKMDYAEASRLTIREFISSLKEMDVREEFELLVENFITAWELVRQRLTDYVFERSFVNKVYCSLPMTFDSKLAMLLPSFKGYCICSLGLINFLVSTQNEFLDQYYAKKNKKCTLTSIPAISAGHSALISYDPDCELIPLVMASRTYSSAVDQPTACSYDFRSIERQLETRFIVGRPKLKAQVDYMVFMEDLTNATIFLQLGEKIPQETLSAEVKEIIRSEIRDVQDISEILRTLDIVVRFLVAIAGDRELSLGDYASRQFGQNTTTLVKMFPRCKLKHVRDLWLGLSHRRAQLLAANGQNPFDAVDDAYRELLVSEQRQALRGALNRMGRGGVEQFADQLYKCILFKITAERNKGQTKDEEETDVEHRDVGLVEFLQEYLKSEDGEQEVQAVAIDIFPRDILVKHCVDVWNRTITCIRNQDANGH